MSTAGRKRRWLSWVAWMAGGLVLLFLAGAAALYFIVPKDKIIARVVPVVEKALNRPVHLDDAGLSFWPPFGVYLAGLRVEDTLSGNDLVRVTHLRGQLAWRQLLSWELHFSSLSASGIFFHYERFDDSTSNLTDLLAGPGGTFPLLVERLEFDLVTFSWADRRDTTAYRVEGVEAELVLDPVSLGFEARLFLPRFESRRGERDTVYHVPLRLSATGHAERQPPALEIERLEGSLLEVPLGGRVRLELPTGRSTLAVQFTVGPAEVDEFLKLAPAPQREAAAGYDLSGQLKLDLSAQGVLDSLTLAEVQARLTWTEGRIADSTGEWLTFGSLAIPVDHEGFHVDAEQVVTRFGPVRLAAVGSWPPEDRLELSVGGRSRLASFFGPDTAGVAGSIDWSASASGPMIQPLSWKLRARAQLSDVRFEEPSRDPFFVDAGEVSYDGTRLRLERLRARYGRSDVQLDGEIDSLSWKDYVSRATLSPRAEFRVRSGRLDLDALFPNLAGDSAAPPDTSARPPLPPGRARLVVDADTLYLGGARWRAVRAEFTLAGDRCEIDTLYGRVYGGRVGLAGRIDSLTSGRPAYAFRLQADSVEVGDVLGRFGSAGRHLRGRSGLSAELAGRGQEPAEVVSGLTIDGTVKLFDARLQELNVAGRIQELLGLELQDPVPLKAVTQGFKVERGRARVDDFKFTTPQGVWILGGSAGLDGSLDYSLAGRLPPELAAKVALPASWTEALPAEWRGRVDPLDLLKADDGSVDLYFRLGGMFRRPEVSVDWDKLQPLWKERFEARVKQKLTSEAEKKLKEGLEGLLDKLKR